MKDRLHHKTLAKIRDQLFFVNGIDKTKKWQIESKGKETATEAKYITRYKNRKEEL